MCINHNAARFGMFAKRRSEITMKSWMNWPDWTVGWSDGLMAWDIAMYLLWNAFVILVAVMISVLIMKRMVARRPETSPLDSLEARYGSGQINKGEFDRMRRELLT
jgi:uncharacterized membrane protein